MFLNNTMCFFLLSRVLSISRVELINYYNLKAELINYKILQKKVTNYVTYHISSCRKCVYYS